MPTSILQAKCVLKQAFVVPNPILWVIATTLEHRAVALLISRPCASTDSICIATMGVVLSPYSVGIDAATLLDINRQRKPQCMVLARRLKQDHDAGHKGPSKSFC
jgi:hypothetical protein